MKNLLLCPTHAPRELRQRSRIFAAACALLTATAGLASGQSFAPKYDLRELPGAAGAGDRLVYGKAASDAFGRTIRTGDVNGDGVQDLIVGANAADVGAPVRADAGAVYIWFGKTAADGIQDAAGVAGTAPDVTIWGASAGDQLTAAGSMLVKDINGDGAADLVLGSSFADGPGEARSSCGEAYVVYGRPNFPEVVDLAIQGPGGADVTVFGATDADSLTSTGAFAAGDFNGDGRQDLLIGAPMADGPGDARASAGEAYLLLGREVFPAVLDLNAGGADVTVYAADASDFLTLGGALTAGDINGDGITDVILAAQGGDGPAEARNSAGEILVVLGRADLPSTIDLGIQGSGGADITIWGATANDLVGSSGALTTGDLDGDGIADLILGASGGDGPSEGRSGAGEVYVIRGRNVLPATLDLAIAGEGGADLTIFGATASDSLSSGGSFVLGDVNGDGVRDLVIGAPLADGPLESRNSAGEAYIIFGGAFGSTVRDLAIQGSAGADVTIYGATGGDNLCIGRTLMIADVNGNGIGDLVLGAPLGDGPVEDRISAGEAYVVRGRSGLPATLDLALTGNAGANVTLYGGTANDQVTSGGALAAGDLNGDGLDDIIFGASAGDGPNETRSGGGEVAVLFGIGTPQIAVSQPAANPIPIGGVKDFGNIGVASGKRLVFTIKNVGAVNLTLGSLTLNGADAGLFHLEPAAAAIVPPGGSTTFAVRFTADAIGTRQALLSISSNDDDQSPFEITLNAQGVVPIPPVVATLDAEITGQVAATMKGTVDAAGSEREVYFEYGTTPSYGAVVRAEPGDVDGTGAIAVQAAVDGLLPKTLYHYRVLAFGPLGEARGEDLTFVTPNQIPVAIGDVFAIQKGVTAVLDVVTNDTDADGDPVSVISFVKPHPSRGDKVELVSGQLVYSTSPAFRGAAFSYVVGDGFGGTATATVTLTPLTCSITPATHTIPAAGGTYAVTVTADGFWKVDGHQHWLTASPSTGYGNGIVTITVPPHSSKNSRKAKITIGGEEHELVQAGIKQPPETLPASLITSFDGLIARDPALNGNLGSRIEVTTTRTGSFTARITTGKTSHAVTGAFKVAEDEILWNAEVTFNRPHLGRQTLALALNSEDLSLSGQLADEGGSHIAQAMGWRNATNPGDYASGYDFVLKQPDTNPALPQGNGNGLMSIQSNGSVYVTGVLSDNSVLTGSTFVGPDGQVLIYQSISANDGSLAGALEVAAAPSVADNSIGGELTWFGQPVAGTKKTPARPGFGPLPLSAEGGAR